MEADHKVSTLYNSNNFNDFLSYFQSFDGAELNKEFFSYNDTNGAKVTYTDFCQFFPYDCFVWKSFIWKVATTMHGNQIKVVFLNFVWWLQVCLHLTEIIKVLSI